MPKFLFILFFLFSQSAIAEYKVWIDADPVCFENGFHDVDDCLAIEALIHSDQVDLMGVSTTTGNSGLEVVNRNVTELMRGTQVVHVLTEESDRESSVDKIYSALVDEDNVHLFAFGALTNIANLLRRYPDIKKNIASIYVVGGMRNLGRFEIGNNLLTHMHDLNFITDEDAFVFVVTSGVVVNVFPFELAEKVQFTFSDYQKLLKDVPRLSRLESELKRWLQQWQKMFDVQYFYPFDLLAVSYLFDRKNFVCDSAAFNLIERRSIFVKSRNFAQFTLTPDDISDTNYCHDIISGDRVIDRAFSITGR